MFSRLSLCSLLAFSQAAAALNLSFQGNCSNTTSLFSGIAYFNTTGTTEFTPTELTGSDEPWYYHVALTDKGSPSSRFIYRMLSIPESFVESKKANETSLCMYTLSGFDKSMKNEKGNDTCSGVISSKCDKAFSDVDTASGCPTVDTTDCDKGNLYSASRISLNERTCFIKSIPGIDVPKGYLTVDLLGVGFGKESEPGSFDDYDKAVKQTIATFLKFFPVDHNSPASSASQITLPICAIPNQVQRDSRPVDSPAGKMGLAKSAAMVVAMSLFYNVILS